MKNIFFKKIKKICKNLLTLWHNGDNINPALSKARNNMERYRSGHNGAVLKTVCLHGRMGSNPILSASKALMQISAFVFLRAEYEK